MTKEKAKELLNNAFSKYDCKHEDKSRCECQSNPFVLEQVVDKIFDEKSSYENELENTVRALMGYVVDMHDVFLEALSPKYKDDMEGLKDHLINKFPILQSTRNKINFRELGESSNWEDVNTVVKKLQEK